MKRCPPSLQQGSQLWKALWKVDMQDRLKLILWKVAFNVLPLRGMFLPANVFNVVAWAKCSLCSEGMKTPLHLFTQCSVARSLWRHSPRPLDITCILLTSMAQLIEFIVIDKGGNTLHHRKH